MPDQEWYNQNSYFPDEPQSLSKNNWVCAPCHAALRRPKLSTDAPTCPKCTADMICIGSRITIPKAADKKAWAALGARLSPPQKT
ncbi:MAG: hypothetical protein ACPGVT_11535 [Maricaulaceae bacterium]